MLIGKTYNYIKYSLNILRITYFITECPTLPSVRRQNAPKIEKFIPYYLNNHLIINSNNIDLDFYIHFTASIRIA